MSVQQRRWELVSFDDLEGTPCPCGVARRAFTESADFPGTIHRTQISQDARLHYHKRLTEIYYFLECDSQAQMELDHEIIPVQPGACLLIPPGVRHRALGNMTVLIVCLPKFDPQDEWFDEGD